LDVFGKGGSGDDLLKIARSQEAVDRQVKVMGTEATPIK